MTNLARRPVVGCGFFDAQVAGQSVVLIAAANFKQLKINPVDE